MEDKNQYQLKMLNLENLNLIDNQQNFSAKRITLNCKNNLLDVVDFSLYSKQIQKFQNLKQIILKYENQPNLQEIQGLDQFLSSIKKLNQLCMSFRSSFFIEEESIQHIANSLYENQTSLKCLQLDFLFCKKLKNEHFSKICEAVAKNKNLKITSLIFGSNDYLTQQIINNLSTCLQDKFHLQKLDLKLNYIKSIENINDLALTLNNLSNLQNLSLSLRGCKSINDDQFSQLFQVFDNFMQLSQLSLDIFDCQINDESIKQLASSLSKCQFLKILYLNLGYLQKIVNIKQLGKAFSEMSSLQDLTLDLFQSENLSRGPFGYFSRKVNKIEKFKIILDFCYSISNKSIKKQNQDLGFLVNLKELSLNLCTGLRLKQELYEDLSRSISGLNHLLVLKLLDLFQIDPESLKTLIRCMKLAKSLRYIKITQTNQNQSIIKHSYESLKIRNTLLKLKYLVHFSYS